MKCRETKKEEERERQIKMRRVEGKGIPKQSWEVEEREEEMKGKTV